jgi:hypothetical protein
MKFRHLMIPAVCVPLTVTGASAGASPASAPASAIGAVTTGAVVRDGAPVDHASVSAVAWPGPDVLDRAPAGKTFTLPVVARTKTDAAGRFSLRIDESRLPAGFRRADGAIDLELVAADSAHEVRWRQTVAPARAAGVRTAASTAGTAPVSFTFDLGDEPSVLAAGAPATSGAGTFAATSAESANRFATAAKRPCGSPLSVTPGARHKGLGEKFMKVLAWSGAKATVEQTTSSTHKLGVGVKYAGGSWSASGSVSLQTKIEGGASTDNVVDAYAWNKVNYRDMNIKCIAPGKDGWTRTDRSPTSFNDLNSKFTRAQHTKLQFCATKLPGRYWKTKGRNVTFDGGVDLGPISVNAQAGFDSTTKLQFNVTKKTKLCGTSSAGWLSSAQVEARRG